MKLYTDKLADVIEAERQHLAKDQTSSATAQYRPQYGLALSGGGIRSAAFALGVMQALVRDGVMSRIDYLSTVSGGGYIGSSLTWWLSRHALEGKQAGTSAEDFPFGRRLDESNTKPASESDGDSKVIDATMQEQILDYLRQHGNYLTPGKGLNTTALGASLLRAVLVSLSVYFSLATLAMLSLFAAITAIRMNISRIEIMRWGPFGWARSLLESLPDPQRMLASFFLGGAIAVGLLFAALCFVYSVLTLFYQLQQLAEQKHKQPGVKSDWSERRYRRRTYSQVALAGMLTTMLALLLIGSLPVLHWVYATTWQTIAAVITLFASGILLVSLRFSKRPYKDGKNHVRHLIQPIIGMFLPLYGLLLSAFVLATYVLSLAFTFEPSITFKQEGVGEFLLWVAGLVTVGLVFGLLVNVNYLGFHRIYRDRLMETFMPDKESVVKNEWGPADGANDALIEEMCDRRPYHIINTNVVLATSTKTKFRGRGGDNFVLSPLYCGSEATGWRRSRDYMKQTDPGMTLATAMAISGAAANPHTGVGGEGLTRHRIVAILMSVLNLRLGFWAPNPRDPGWWPPNFIYPGLTGGVLSRGLREDLRFVDLTDGGHFENLGLYELIRRRLKIIIVCDGTADPTKQYGDLAVAIQRAKVDCKAKIRFENLGFGLELVRPGSGEVNTSGHSRTFAKNGFAVGKITYESGETGTLIYIKSTLTADLTADIYAYKYAHPAFPDETTADQFFSETQFEVYRELGYQLGRQMLKANEKEQWLN